MVQNIYIKKVLTYKSGNFILSRKFTIRQLQPLTIEARILYETVKDLPILPELASTLQQDLIRRSIHGTAAIEGNPLTEEQVGQIIEDQKEKISGERAEQEIRNLKNAYDLLHEFKTKQEPQVMPKLNEGLILKVHKLITRNIKHEYNNPGYYRNHIVKVGNAEHGGIFTPPKCLEDIKKLMNEYIDWMNCDEVSKLDPPIRAAIAHYYLALIHPFGDGNGRTARWIEAMILLLSGIKYVPIMLSNFYYRNMDDYFWAFSNSIRKKDNDITPFLKFVLEGVIESLKEIKESITFYIRKFSLQRYYGILKENKVVTQRQSDLLVTLLDYNYSISLKDLFNLQPFNILYRNVSDRTARRDLKKLSDSATGPLLRVNKDKKYGLNWKALE